MLTSKLISTLESIRPFEQRLRAFFSKKAPRLIALGSVAATASLIYWNIENRLYYFLDIAPIIGFIALIYTAITTAAVFFAGIGKFTLTKFIIADIVAAIVHLSVDYVFNLPFIDYSIENVYWLMAKNCLESGKFTYIPAIMLSLLTGLLISRKKTPRAE